MMGPGSRRKWLSRLLVIPLIAIQLYTPSTFDESSLYEVAFENLGILLVGVSMLGRAWSSLFISGHKTHDLITVGPYSIVRNPLYVFSFIGAVGIGLCSQNILFLVAITLLFLFYYPTVVYAEEARLKEVHGSVFEEYAKNVPRFIPNLSLYSCPVYYQIDTKRVFRTLRDSLAFLLVFAGFEIIEHLHFSGYFLPLQLQTSSTEKIALF